MNKTGGANYFRLGFLSARRLVDLESPASRFASCQRDGVIIDRQSRCRKTGMGFNGSGSWREARGMIKWSHSWYGQGTTHPTHGTEQHTRRQAGCSDSSYTREKKILPIITPWASPLIDTFRAREEGRKRQTRPGSQGLRQELLWTCRPGSDCPQRQTSPADTRGHLVVLGLEVITELLDRVDAGSSRHPLAIGADDYAQVRLDDHAPAIRTLFAGRKRREKQ